MAVNVVSHVLSLHQHATNGARQVLVLPPIDYRRRRVVRLVLIGQVGMYRQWINLPMYVLRLGWNGTLTVQCTNEDSRSVHNPLELVVLESKGGVGSIHAGV